MAKPELHVQPGDLVHLTLENGDGMPHDVALPDYGVQTPQVSGHRDSRAVTFEIGEGITGEFPYFCTVMSHRQAGMEGRLIVDEEYGSG